MTVEDVERSNREFELAAGLRDEGNVPSALDHLRTALELDSENAEAHLLMGLIQLERHDAAAAESSLRRGIDLLVHAERPGSVLAEGRNWLGLALIELGRFDDAIGVLQLAAADEMNTAPHLAWGNLGLAQQRKGDHAAAIASFTRAVGIEPRFCVGFYRMGVSLSAEEHWQEAEQALTQAVEADPTCANAPPLQGAWRLRGEARARLGFRDEAISDFERCIELGPRSAEGAQCQAFLDGAH